MLLQQRVATDPHIDICSCNEMIKSEIVQVFLCEAMNLATGHESKYEYNVLTTGVFEIYAKQYLEWRAVDLRDSVIVPGSAQHIDAHQVVHPDVAGTLLALSGGMLRVSRTNNLAKAGIKTVEGPIVHIPTVLTEQSHVEHFQDSMPQHTRAAMWTEVAHEGGGTLSQMKYPSPCVLSSSVAPPAREMSPGENSLSAGCAMEASLHHVLDRTQRVHRAKGANMFETEEYKLIRIYANRILKVKRIMTNEIRKVGVEQMKTNVTKMLQNVTGLFCVVPDMVETEDCDERVTQLQTQMHFLLPHISLQNLQENVRRYEIYNTGMHLLTDEAEPIVFPNARSHNATRLPREVVSVCRTTSFVLSENISKNDCRFQLISALRTDIVTNLLHFLF